MYVVVVLYLAKRPQFKLHQNQFCQSGHTMPQVDRHDLHITHFYEFNYA